MRRLLLLLALPLLLAPCAQAWTWPVSGRVLRPFSFDRASPYAAGQHRGVDLAGAPGEAVLAAAAGVVSFAGTVPESGKTVALETADGWSVTYTHLGAIAVRTGQAVAEGEPVGTLAAADPGGGPPFVQLGIRSATDPQGYVDPLGLLPPRPETVSAPPPAPPPAPEPAPPVAAGAAAPPPSVAAPAAPAPPDAGGAEGAAPPAPVALPAAVDGAAPAGPAAATVGQAAPPPPARPGRRRPPRPLARPPARPVRPLRPSRRPRRRSARPIRRARPMRSVGRSPRRRCPPRWPPGQRRPSRRPRRRRRPPRRFACVLPRTARRRFAPRVLRLPPPAGRGRPRRPVARSHSRPCSSARSRLRSRSSRGGESCRDPLV